MNVGLSASAGRRIFLSRVGPGTVVLRLQSCSPCAPSVTLRSSSLGAVARRLAGRRFFHRCLYAQLYALCPAPAPFCCPPTSYLTAWGIRPGCGLRPAATLLVCCPDNPVFCCTRLPEAVPRSSAPLQVMGSIGYASATEQGLSEQQSVRYADVCTPVPGGSYARSGRQRLPPPPPRPRHGKLRSDRTCRARLTPGSRSRPVPRSPLRTRSQEPRGMAPAPLNPDKCI